MRAIRFLLTGIMALSLFSYSAFASDEVSNYEDPSPSPSPPAAAEVSPAVSEDPPTYQDSVILGMNVLHNDLEDIKEVDTLLAASVLAGAGLLLGFGIGRELFKMWL